MNILIYGGGAVGLGLAGCLIHSREKVDIIARKATTEALRKNGLFRTGVFGDIHAAPDQFRAFESLNELPPENTYDYILVCTKSYDSEMVAGSLADNPLVAGPHTGIVLCQNGWGNAETFAACFDETRIWNARVITGFTRPSPNHVEITVHVDAIHIGSIFGTVADDLENLCASITRGGIPCKSTSRITRDMWAKMLYNCALNPLGAIFNVPYGKLGESGHTRLIMKRIIEEIYRVLEKTPYRTNWKTADEYLDVFFNKLIPATARHEASTLQDIKAQKRTEIDALNGAVVRLGKKHSINVSTNEMIYEMIKFKEDQYLKQ
ncbi:MAG: 2-dehydropantoate 2-reductase [Pseudomonadota bacterium]